VASTRGVADIVRHYTQKHCLNRPLKDIAAELKQRTGSGSATSISAWAGGHRRPAIRQVKTLRIIVGCQCTEFGDEAINYAYSLAASEAADAPGGRPGSRQRAAVRIGVQIPPDIPAVHRPPRQHIVGREDEVRDFAELQAGRTAHRLVNIFGPGGIGKTEVFLKLVVFGEQHGSVLGHADVAEIKHAGHAQQLTIAEILRDLAATINRPELDPFRRDLWDHDLATTAVRTSGGIDRMFGLNGRPLNEADLPQAAESASPGLREVLRSRFAFERYLRRAPTALTRAFCDGLSAVAEAGGGAATLLLDTYEEIGGLDDWVCREVVPTLPEHTRVMLLSRRQLTKTNIDWLDHQHIVQERPLPELSEQEAKSYLRQCGLTQSKALEGVYAVTGGYPLLLVLARALAAESGGWEPIGELEHDRDRDKIARGLLERILREARVRNIREVLETCSIAPWINPDIITALLGTSPQEAQTLYTELAAHAFVTRHPRGVALHDKIRELLQVRLKFAGETRYEELKTLLTMHLGSKGGVPCA
jgi:hypothetical protein